MRLAASSMTTPSSSLTTCRNHPASITSQASRCREDIGRRRRALEDVVLGESDCDSDGAVGDAAADDYHEELESLKACVEVLDEHVGRLYDAYEKATHRYCEQARAMNGAIAMLSEEGRETCALASARASSEGASTDGDKTPTADNS